MTLFRSTVSISEVKPSQYKFFSCGEPSLDEYLKRFAKGNEKKGIGRNFMLLDQDQMVVGYYTLCMAQVDFIELPDDYQEGLPKYPVPAARLCRLAVDETMQGKKFGEHLLMDAIERVLAADQIIAAYTLIVDAKNLKAKQFYQKYHFLPLREQNMKLFLPLSTLRKL